MIDWTIDDEEMRGHMLDRARAHLAEVIQIAARSEREAQDMTAAGQRKEASACAAYHRRAAQHVQQAIDLLTAAPMPAKEK